jgi:hypothetical protein
MASVQVALKGPSAAAVQARLEEIARDAGVDLSPVQAMAGFTAGTPTTDHEIVSAMHAPALDEDHLRVKLAPFVDEDADPLVAVRFTVLP